MSSNPMMNKVKVDHIEQLQNLEKIFYKMNSTGNPYNLNLKNDGSSLISRINNTIMIPEHPHPLFSCLTPERNLQSSCWNCKNCGCKYLYSVPSFYCTGCDYDICQKCIAQHPIYKVKFYNFSQKEIFVLDKIVNKQNYRPNIHGHVMALIKFEGSNAKIQPFPCRKCNVKINSTDAIYFCSLCNFYVCKNCFNVKNMQTILNPNDINPQFKIENSPDGYLSYDPMDEKKIKEYRSGDQMQTNNDDDDEEVDRQYLSGDQMQFK